jgi:hypothetical protein
MKQLIFATLILILMMVQADVCPIFKCGSIEQIFKPYTLCANYKNTASSDIMIDTCGKDEICSALLWIQGDVEPPAI